MNEIATQRLRLRDFMPDADGWGRAAGRAVYAKLMEFVESHAGVLVFQVSVAGINHIDISFASETLVELARRYRGKKGFAFIDLSDTDQRENWDAAAQRGKQPIICWDRTGKPSLVGPPPSQGTVDGFRFALGRKATRAAEFAAHAKDVSITNASSKFKQLWEQGYLLRAEATADSGGMEYIYVPIK